LLSLLFIPLLLFWTLLPAAAQEMPRCTPDTAGALACMAGRACACSFQRGGLMLGQPDGWRWDCGILRGRCERPTVQPWPIYDLPPGFSLDQSDNSIHMDQTTGVNGGGQQNIDPHGFPRRLFPDGPLLEKEFDLPR
jgi:hypothetical protein